MAVPPPPESSSGESKGIMISRGVTPSFPPGALSFFRGPDGTLQSDARLHLRFDVCPVWLEISLDHLQRAEREHQNLIVAWRDQKSDEAALAMESEFRAGVQATASACIALDAFYANVREYIPIPEEMQRGWLKKKNSRAFQLAEVLRRGFTMKTDTADRVRDIVKQIYDFRDLAIHPSGKTKEAVLHPDLQVGVEWRFISFGFTNVKEVVAGCLSLVAQLVEKPKPNLSELVFYCTGVRPNLGPVVASWEAHYGILFKRAGSAP